MKKKVVIMQSALFTKRWASQYCTDELSNSFDLEYWDCSILTSSTSKGIVLEREYVYTPSSLEEMKRMLRALPQDTLIISNIHFLRKNFKLHRLISKFFKHRIYIDFWSNRPSKIDESRVEMEIPKKKTLKQYLYQVGWIQVLAKFIRYGGGERFKTFYSVYRNIRKCEQTIKDEQYCENLYTNHVITCLPHHQYSINHPDYEKYLQIKDGARLIKDDFIVFIDEYFPYIPDYKENNPEINCDLLAEIYYRTMTRFFDAIEQRTGLKVIIAAHPMSDYSINPFGNREVRMYETAELIRDSKYVCMHHSFCISYVALFDKPVCFISNEAVRRSRFCFENTCSNASMVNLPVIDSDRIEDYDIVFKRIPSEYREKYINRFFDMKVKKTNAELLKQYLNQIYQDIAK